MQSLSRLVSAYMDSVVDWQNKGNHKYKGHTFETFLKELVIKAARISKNKQKYEEMSLDWRPYATTTCNFCRVPFTVIQKTDTFNEDRRNILEMVGLANETDPVQRHIHTGDKIQDITRDLFKNIPEKVKNEVIKLYEYEFDMFEYDTTMY